MTDIQFEPTTATLVVAHHAELGPSLLLNFLGRYVDGSEVRVPGLPEHVETMVSISSHGSAATPDHGTVGKLWAPGHGVFAYDIQLRTTEFDALLKGFQARILPSVIQMEVPGLEMPASGGFYWRDIGQAMPISGVQIYFALHQSGR